MKQERMKELALIGLNTLMTRKIKILEEYTDDEIVTCGLATLTREYYDLSNTNEPKYREVRVLSWCSVYALCNANHYYTKGFDSDFESLRKTIESLDDVTTDDIAAIAIDIVDHSDYPQLKDEMIDNVAFQLFKLCDTFIELV